MAVVAALSGAACAPRARGPASAAARRRGMLRSSCTVTVRPLGLSALRRLHGAACEAWRIAARCSFTRSLARGPRRLVLGPELDRRHRRECSRSARAR